jgi:hypothetical protein
VIDAPQKTVIFLPIERSLRESLLFASVFALQGFVFTIAIVGGLLSRLGPKQKSAFANNRKGSHDA